MARLPYTLESFRRIVDQEERRGRNLMRTDFLVRECSDVLKARRARYLEDRKRESKESEGWQQLRAEYLEQRRDLRRKRDEAVVDALDRMLRQFEGALEGESFTWQLRAGPQVGKRQTFVIPGDLELILPMKQAGSALRQAADLSPLSRNSIVRALQTALRRPYEHSIMRIDLENFFDSIPHEPLLRAMAHERKVDGITIRLVRQLLDEYASLTHRAQGIPQGVSLSSQLAEFYLKRFDKAIRSHRGVLFYARYVDDIVAVIETPRLLDVVCKQIDDTLDGMGLKENNSKRKRFTTGIDGGYPTSESIEYLGYKFTNQSGGLETRLTDKRALRQRERINLAFAAWLKHAPEAGDPNHGADGLLVDRLRYLSSNTKLHASKSNVAIGIFFSNSALDPECPQLEELDQHLRSLIDEHAHLMSELLKSKLKAISFVSGFRDRTFIRFKQQRAERIAKCWMDLT